MLATRLIHGEAHRESLENGNSRGMAERTFARFGQWFSTLDATYRRGLAWAIHHRLVTIGGALAITTASLLLLPQIGTELMPATDSGDFTINVKMPPGTALAKTDATMRQVEQIVMANPSVGAAFSAAGSNLSMRGTSTALIPYQGSVQVKLRDDRKQSTLQVIADLRRQLSQLPGAQARLTQFDLVTNLMTGGNQNVEVDIFGDDLGALSTAARDILGRARSVRGLENLDVNWQDAMPEIQWRVDRQKALQLGITFSDIANTINTATNGTITSYFQEKGFQYPIIVQMPEATRKTVPDLQNLAIDPSTPGGSPQSILLGQVAQPIYAMGPSQITRLDRQRYIAVTGTPQGRSAGEIQSDLQKIMSEARLPAGFYWDWGTDQKRRAEEFGGMGIAVVLAIALIYMLLASQFESFVHPMTILLSVPLAGSGVLLGLFLTGRAFGLTAAGPGCRRGRAG
jgi:HAE1 family hydrophobic/amphiphilic exporter-1